MFASKTLGAAAFAGPAHCLMLVWRPVGLDRDIAEALAECHHVAKRLASELFRPSLGEESVQGLLKLGRVKQADKDNTCQSASQMCIVVDATPRVA